MGLFKIEYMIIFKKSAKGKRIRFPNQLNVSVLNPDRFQKSKSTKSHILDSLITKSK